MAKNFDHIDQALFQGAEKHFAFGARSTVKAAEGVNKKTDPFWSKFKGKVILVGAIRRSIEEAMPGFLATRSRPLPDDEVSIADDEAMRMLLGELIDEVKKLGARSDAAWKAIYAGLQEAQRADPSNASQQLRRYQGEAMASLSWVSAPRRIVWSEDVALEILKQRVAPPEGKEWVKVNQTEDIHLVATRQRLSRSNVHGAADAKLSTPRLTMYNKSDHVVDASLFMSDDQYTLGEEGKAEYIIFINLWPALGWIDVHIIPVDILLDENCVGTYTHMEGQKASRWRFLSPQFPRGRSTSREVTLQHSRNIFLMKFVWYFRLHPANEDRYMWLAYEAK